MWPHERVDPFLFPSCLKLIPPSHIYIHTPANSIPRLRDLVRHPLLRPQPPQTTHGVQSADRQPVQCMQSPYGSKGRTPFRGNGTSGAVSTKTVEEVLGGRELEAELDENEDCLFLKYVYSFRVARQINFPFTNATQPILSVFVPGKLESKKNLPVVFWMHGWVKDVLILHPVLIPSSSIFSHCSGGYVVGNATVYGTNGNDLIRKSGGNVVVVIIQYRLGLFGFLPGQKVKDGGALNAGLCTCFSNY